MSNYFRRPASDTESHPATFLARCLRCFFAFLFATLSLAAETTADEARAQTARHIPNVASSPGTASVAANSGPGSVSNRIADALDMPIHLDPRPGATESVGEGSSSSMTRATSTLVGSLAVCLGAFLLFVWAMRRAVPRSLAPLPSEVVELLGRASLAARQQMQLVRVGKKLVLVCVTPTGVSTLTEISDEAEVERLAGLCHQTKPNSASAAFRDILGQYNEESKSRGFVGDRVQSDFEIANRGGRRRPTREGNHDV